MIKSGSVFRIPDKCLHAGLGPRAEGAAWAQPLRVAGPRFPLRRLRPRGLAPRGGQWPPAGPGFHPLSPVIQWGQDFFFNTFKKGVSSSQLGFVPSLGDWNVPVGKCSCANCWRQEMGPEDSGRGQGWRLKGRCYRQEKGNWRLAGETAFVTARSPRQSREVWLCRRASAGPTGARQCDGEEVGRGGDEKSLGETRRLGAGRDSKVCRVILFFTNVKMFERRHVTARA